MLSAKHLGPLASSLQSVRNATTKAFPETEELLVSAVKSKRVVTLNRPKALNALNLNMIRSMYPRLKEWNADKRVSMVIVKGSGEKAFCAGGDVLAVTRSAKANDGSTIHKDFFREEYHLNHLIGTCSKPYVALIDGITMGGGCGLSVNGRFRVATERTMLAMPETALGLFPDVGGSYFLSRLRNNLGMYLALTGYRLQGADVYHAGLATHIVNSKDLPEIEKALLDLPSEDVSERRVDDLLKEFRPSDVKTFSLSGEIDHIKKLFEGKTLEEILKKLAEDNSEWAQRQLKILSKMSPTSMKVTFRQLNEGLVLSYANIFTMEYRLTQRFVEDHDFHEGCRAILIDKDHNPKWSPAKLEEVTQEKVDWYFSPLPQGQDLILLESK